MEIVKFGAKCRGKCSAEGGYLLSGVSVLYMKCDLWHTVQTVECGGCGGGGGVSPSSVSRTRGSVSPGPAPSLAALVEGGPGNHGAAVIVSSPDTTLDTASSLQSTCSEHSVGVGVGPCSSCVLCIICRVWPGPLH